MVHTIQTEIDNYNELLGLKIHVRGVLLNRFTSTVQSYAAIDKLETSGFQVFDTHIREVRSTKNQLEIAINSGKSIYETVPNCAFARDLIKFIEKLVG